MSEWSFDMAKAPRGKIRLIATRGTGTRKIAEPAQIIAASACGIVTISQWIEDEKRWSMFTPDAPPIAWMPHTGPETVVGEDGKARKVVRLPAHPTMATSWFSDLMAERRVAA